MCRTQLADAWVYPQCWSCRTNCGRMTCLTESNSTHMLITKIFWILYNKRIFTDPWYVLGWYSSPISKYGVGGHCIISSLCSVWMQYQLDYNLVIYAHTTGLPSLASPDDAAVRLTLSLVSTWVATSTVMAGCIGLKDFNPMITSLFNFIFVTCKRASREVG